MPAREEVLQQKQEIEKPGTETFARTSFGSNLGAWVLRDAAWKPALSQAASDMGGSELVEAFNDLFPLY